LGKECITLFAVLSTRYLNVIKLGYLTILNH